ncbi:restriction endonuclease subunit S [Pseudomonas sp. HK3]
MSNLKKKDLFPALRFPEFRSLEGWDRFKLIDVADKNTKWSFIGGPFGSNLKSSDYVEKGIRIIQLQNIGDGEFKEEYRIFTTIKKADELLANNIYPGNIIISKMGDPVGRACIIPDTHDRYVMCSDGIRLVVDEKLHSKYFIYCVINDNKFRSTIEKSATGSTRKRIGLDDLKKLPMFLPFKAEQQKIADCLSSIDNLITAHNQKLEAIKDHKKGLMQQLFPAEGETVPKLRFPGFRGEWRETTLGEVVEYENGKAHEKDIDEKGEFIVVNSKFISTEGGVVKYTNSANLLAAKNDILMVLSDIPNGRAIAKCFYVEEDRRHTVNQRISKLTAKDAVSKLMFYLINKNPYFLAFDDGVKQTNLKKDDVLDCPIFLPTDKREQQKIADCLSFFDNHTTAQIQKIESLKSHKKGLMQQLFPSIDEVGV